MPATKAARQSVKRYQRNRSTRSYTRAMLRNARNSVDYGEPTAEADVRAAISALDKAVKKGVLHKNNASRRKARLAARLNKSQASNTPS